jgi:hypothetical protein
MKFTFINYLFLYSHTNYIDHRKIDHNDDLKYDLNLMTPQNILLLWPESSKDIGHYSRTMKGSNESMKSLFFLNKHVEIGY